jgi:hypothetical protein
MQLAAGRVGHMQLRLAQWQRTSTKTYCDEHGTSRRRRGLLQDKMEEYKNTEGERGVVELQVVF